MDLIIGDQDLRRRIENLEPMDTIENHGDRHWQMFIEPKAAPTSYMTRVVSGKSDEQS